MSNEFADLPNPAVPDSPVHAVFDWLYRVVAAIELSPAVAVHSQDPDGIVHYWNHTCVELFGVPVAQALGRPLATLVSRLDRQEEFAALMAEIWRTGRPGAPREWEVQLPDGSRRWLYSSHFPILRAGLPQQLFCMEMDITARKQVELAQAAASRHQAEHDALTGLPNRVLFLDRLRQALAQERRQHRQFALLFLDLDRFKQINDTLGHAAGDEVLREVARRLVRCVRGVDTVCRLGGDEFVLLLADIGGADQAAHVGHTVLRALAEPVAFEGQALTLSVSIGIALGPADGQDGPSLLRHADVAMYHAKQQGRNTLRFFSPTMNAQVIERVRMENLLRAALDHGEFALAFQPEIELASGRTLAVEALLRWRHPERGLLLPQAFLGIAEASGLMEPIGAWVLDEACRHARLWRDGGYPAVVAVNLSPAQFAHQGLAARVAAALARAGLEPRWLDLEVTEAMLMDGAAPGADGLAALRAQGVQLTLDNFGTGYSRLASLRRLGLSKLKIDRSFIASIANDADEAALIPAIIALAHQLQLRVVAEGVETAEQLRFLQRHGCDAYQGWYAAVAAQQDAPRPPG